jgi:hypothetical protein
MDADGNSNLGACGAREDLAKRYQVSIALFVDPFPAFDVFFQEVAQMGDWPAE